MKVNVPLVETGNVIHKRGMSSGATGMVAAHPSKDVARTKVTVRMTPIAFLDWYVAVKTVQKMSDSVTELTAVNFSLMYLNQVII